MTATKKETWIQFHENDMPKGDKTKIWGINTKDETPILLGFVQWKAGWRKYAFFR